MARSGVLLGLLLAALLVGGCRSKAPGAGQKDLPDSVSTQTSAPVVEPIDGAGYQTLVKNRAGRVLFVNLWATWCAPCVEELPDLARLSRAVDTSQVEVVGISADYPDEIDSKIVPLLKKQNVPYRIFVAKFDHQEDFINTVNRSWSGALPATVIYDRQGKQQYFGVGQSTFAQFMDEINKVREKR